MPFSPSLCGKKRAQLGESYSVDLHEQINFERILMKEVGVVLQDILKCRPGNLVHLHNVFRSLIFRVPNQLRFSPSTVVSSKNELFYIPFRSQTGYWQSM